LRQAVKLALLSGASTVGVTGMSAAYAQEPEQIEEITVTGSRIPNANLISASPVTQINSEDFEIAGATRVEDLLNTFPQIAPTFDSFTVNPTTGFATADLRGLGSERTLVLVNGHRLQPGGIRGEQRDLNQIPAAMIKRVEVLTGGASAVYGSDAMSGVVNFILDKDFEGVNVKAGYSGYQHKNDDGYMRGLMDAAGFDYPSGSSGPDGESYNIDMAIGGSFAQDRGNAMAWFTWRDNTELRQGARDYSSCSLNNAGTACGGSSTSPIPNFFVTQIDDTDPDPDNHETLFGGFAHHDANGGYLAGQGQSYNFGPINHYQRPDERYTFGGAMSYEMAPQFRPYIETMFATTSTSVQIAESGTFFVNSLQFTCGDPTAVALLGSMCTDLGLDPNLPFSVEVGKRNNEGGPRIANLDSSSFRVVTGVEGDISQDWSYNFSFLYGRTSNTEANVNDLVASRVGSALLACADPALRDTPACYNVWEPGGVTVDAASLLSGNGMRTATTQLTGIGGYVTGITGITVPGAADPVALVAGYEYRKDEYARQVDDNMQTGNFTGLGGPRLPLVGSFDVNEIYFEAGVPLLTDRGALQSLSLDLGYRYSDYDTSGGANTYKIGAVAQITDMFRLRGGYNRAIRAPNTTELFRDQQLQLAGGTDDKCAVAADNPNDVPLFTPEQCAHTGVSASQYGNILKSPASQYNQHAGGNPDLQPEEADTYTIGFVATPIENLQFSIDYFSIEMEDKIGSIGWQTIFDSCALTGDPLLCGRINRGPAGDLWVGSSLATAGHIVNLDDNIGNLTFTGIDVLASYNWDAFGGLVSANLVGTYVLEKENDPLPGIVDAAAFDCAGVINSTCQNLFQSGAEWRHTARLSYAREQITGHLGWRYVGEVDYRNTDGSAATTDQLLVNNGGKISAVNYIDLTGVYDVNDYASVIVGVNNVFDETPPLVGGTLSLNANSPGGYDQIGRFMHATVNIDFDF
jgi:outer membrane receptor protein involved in Fe transport